MSINTINNLQVTLNVYPSPTTNGDYLGVFNAVAVQQLKQDVKEVNEEEKQDTIPHLPPVKYVNPEEPITDDQTSKQQQQQQQYVTGTMNTNDRFMVILDRSGSMGDHTTITIQKTLPEVFSALHYLPEHPIDLVLFDDRVEHHVHSVSEFPTLPYDSRGGTSLGPVLGTVESILRGYPFGTSVKILTISDGDVWDIDDVVKNSTHLKNVIDVELSSKISITSHSLRMFTSTYANPDTRALSVLLNLGTSQNVPELKDVNVLDYGTSCDEIYQCVKNGLTLTPEQQILFDKSPKGHAKVIVEMYKDSTSSFAAITAERGMYSVFSYLRQQQPDCKDACLFTPNDFISADLCQMVKITSFFKQHPWSSPLPYLSVPITEGQTLFWLDKTTFDTFLQTKQSTAVMMKNDNGIYYDDLFIISDQYTISLSLHSAITPEQYEEVILNRFNYYIMMAKLLCVVNSPQSKIQLEQITEYFSTLEAALYSEVDALEKERSHAQYTLEMEAVESKGKLMQRFAQAKRLLTKSSKRLGAQLAEINNMGKYAQFDSAQAASFLRGKTAGGGKAAKSLVRRNGGKLDFAATVREQVRALAEKLPELEANLDIDENDLNISFVSLSSTLDGLRMITQLCTTAMDGSTITLQEATEQECLLDKLDTLEILSFLNIVGIPVQATVGFYPDPYQYNISTVFTGHYCSLSDIISQHVMSTDKESVLSELCVPGYKGDTGRVDNVIPIFESPKIFQFLYENAPDVLQYYLSMGMRRMIAGVPNTLQACLSAALLKLMKVVTVEPTEVNITALKSIYSSLQICTGNDIIPVKQLLYAIQYVKSQQSTLPRIDLPLTQLLPHLIQLYGVLLETKNNDNDELLEIYSTTQKIIADKLFLKQQSFVSKYFKHRFKKAHEAAIQRNMGQNVRSRGRRRGGARHGTTRSDKPSHIPFLKRFETAINRVSEELRPKLFPLPSIGDLRESLPVIMRAVYNNAVYTQIRGLFNGQQQGPQIIDKMMNDLLAFNPDTCPAPVITTIENGIPQFVPAAEILNTTTIKATSTATAEVNIIPQSNRAMFSMLMKTPTFIDLNHQLNHINIIALIPTIAELVNVNTPPSAVTIPPVLASRESIIQQQEYERVKSIINTIKRDGEYEIDGYEEEEDFRFDESNVTQQDAIEYLKKRLQLQKRTNAALSTLIPQIFTGKTDNNDDDGGIVINVEIIKMIKFVTILSALQFNRLKQQRYPVPLKSSVFFAKNGTLPLSLENIDTFPSEPLQLSKPRSNVPDFIDIFTTAGDMPEEYTHITTLSNIKGLITQKYIAQYNKLVGIQQHKAIISTMGDTIKTLIECDDIDMFYTTVRGVFEKKGKNDKYFAQLLRLLTALPNPRKNNNNNDSIKLQREKVAALILSCEVQNITTVQLPESNDTVVIRFDDNKPISNNGIPIDLNKNVNLAKKIKKLFGELFFNELSLLSTTDTHKEEQEQEQEQEQSNENISLDFTPKIKIKPHYIKRAITVKYTNYNVQAGLIKYKRMSTNDFEFNAYHNYPIVRQ